MKCRGKERGKRELVLARANSACWKLYLWLFSTAHDRPNSPKQLLLESTLMSFDWIRFKVFGQVLVVTSSRMSIPFFGTGLPNLIF